MHPRTKQYLAAPRLNLRHLCGLWHLSRCSTGTKHKTDGAACKCPKSCAPASGSGEREKYVQASACVLILNARPGNTTEEQKELTNKEPILCISWLRSHPWPGLGRYFLAHRDCVSREQALAPWHQTTSSTDHLSTEVCLPTVQSTSTCSAVIFFWRSRGDDPVFENL